MGWQIFFNKQMEWNFEEDKGRSIGTFQMWFLYFGASEAETVNEKVYVIFDSCFELVAAPKPNWPKNALILISLCVSNCDPCLFCRFLR